MKLIVGLGNPEEKYKNNRHNAGFILVNYLASFLGGSFEKNKQVESLVLKSDEIILAKPLTFMNDSGRAVLKLVNFYQVNLDSLFVAYDDLDIKLGEYKIVFGKPPKTHNGILSVIDRLRTGDFWHIRIGVENRGVERTSGEKYVLQDFLDDEKLVVENVVKDISKELI